MDLESDQMVLLLKFPTFKWCCSYPNGANPSANGLVRPLLTVLMLDSIFLSYLPSMHIGREVWVVDPVTQRKGASWLLLRVLESCHCLRNSLSSYHD